MSSDFLLILCFILQSHSVAGLWSCSQDADCASLAGSVCTDGSCVCTPGTESVLGGTLCAEVAPYHTSYCVEDHQCSRLVTSFECRQGIPEVLGGNCFCREGFHYYLGRCWNSIDYGEPCQRSEECMSPLRNPHSLTCNQTCQCADGYYLRQRGECRKIGFAVGDGCVLDQDCHFANAACNITSFRCYDTSAGPETIESQETIAQEVIVQPTSVSSRQHGAACSVLYPCPEPFICNLGACICPVGYYASSNGAMCLAELGSPSTEEQCVGLFAEVRNGICTCMANFFFEENMRDCIKATRRITDSCVTDSNCFTFGAASRCGPPQDPWFLRNCECVPELAVWDATRNMCRLFVGIGEQCEADSDCMAGDMEITCIRNEDDIGICTCPEGLTPVDGLCLTTGLGLNDTCQVSTECTGTPHTVCTDGRCSCDIAYHEMDDFCAPLINGTCVADADCVTENTVCVNTTDAYTCQCSQGFIEEDGECWPAATGFEAQCNVSSQCRETLGADSECVNGRCRCADSFHHRDGRCWPMTGLFEPCTRRSQCYLTGMSERVTCRNSMCQCEFNYPYSEELHTCFSSAGSLLSSAWLLSSALIYLYSL